MGAILSILKLEIKSYLTNTSALFWTFIYPILMLLLLIFVFSKNTTEIFYFNNIRNQILSHQYKRTILDFYLSYFNALITDFCFFKKYH